MLDKTIIFSESVFRTQEDLKVTLEQGNARQIILFLKSIFYFDGSLCLLQGLLKMAERDKMRAHIYIVCTTSPANFSGGRTKMRIKNIYSSEYQNGKNDFDLILTFKS